MDLDGVMAGVVACWFAFQWQMIERMSDDRARGGTEPGAERVANDARLGHACGWNGSYRMPSMY
jgi:hypothetical protein